MNKFDYLFILTCLFYVVFFLHFHYKEDPLRREVEKKEHTLRRELKNKGTLSPFTHKPPHFVTKEDEDVFLLQPENRDSMKADWVPSWDWETCIDDERSDEAYFKLFGGEIWSFQHFFDNGLPLVWQVRELVSSSRIQTLYTYIRQPRDQIVLELWRAMGFADVHFTDSTGNKNTVTACVFPRNTQVRAHPTHVAMLRSLLSVPKEITPKKMVWVSRTHAAHGRKVSNQPSVVKELNKTYNVHVVDQCTTVDKCLSVFGDAAAIVGVHGGGMYNQFFASTKTKIIEIMPITNKGLLHGQASAASTPKLAHRAIWHNANTIGQPFYRLHEETPSVATFDISDKTLENIKTIMETHDRFSR